MSYGKKQVMVICAGLVRVGICSKKDWSNYQKMIYFRFGENVKGLSGLQNDLFMGIKNYWSLQKAKCKQESWYCVFI